MKSLSKLGREWTPADLKKMRQLAKDNVSARVAARALGRTRGAVAYKAMTEGVHFASIRQPRGVQKRRFARAAAVARPRRRSK